MPLQQHLWHLLTHPHPPSWLLPHANYISTVATWRHRLSCHCRAGGYPLCRRAPPLSRTTGPRWGSPRSSSSSLFSVPSSPYASGPSSFSRTIPSTSALTWAWRMCSSPILTRPKRGSTPLDRWSYMDREDMMSTDTGKDQQHDSLLKLHHTDISWRPWKQVYSNLAFTDLSP